MPSFWPHVWAIPMVFFAGFVVGWVLRSVAPVDRRDSPGPPEDYDA